MVGDRQIRILRLGGSWNFSTRGRILQIYLGNSHAERSVAPLRGGILEINSKECTFLLSQMRCDKVRGYRKCLGHDTRDLFNFCLVAHFFLLWVVTIKWSQSSLRLDLPGLFWELSAPFVDPDPLERVSGPSSAGKRPKTGQNTNTNYNGRYLFYAILSLLWCNMSL